jgi:hypothetical protein
MSDEVDQRVDAAISESKKTGKQVNINVTDIENPHKEKRRFSGMKKVEESRFKEGEGVQSVLDETAKRRGDDKVDCGNFRIVEKNLIKADEENGEEKDRWEYKFEWDEKFAEYAAASMDKPEGLSPEEIDTFCYAILLAQQTDQLEGGVKVEEREEEKRRKFYKKY